jgi:NAD(P)-dependent dehydrogenase (short-subunit alcohol dehydrogenase family)
LPQADGGEFRDLGMRHPGNEDAVGPRLETLLDHGLHRRRRSVDQGGSGQEEEEEVAAAYPLKRLGRPEDAAGAVAYLASDDAARVSGDVLPVDGGLAVAGGTA